MRPKVSLRATSILTNNGGNEVRVRRVFDTGSCFRRPPVLALDIEREYGWSPKTTARIEHAPNSNLIPTIVGKNGGRTKRYFRPHIEAILRDSFVSLRALAD